MRDPNRYAVLARIRKQDEELKARDLAASLRDLQRAERERTSLELTRRQALESAGELLGTSFDAADVRGYYQYERHLMALRDTKDAEVRELKRIEDEKRSALEQATRTRQIAEKLHERRREQYWKFLERNAQNQLDETATIYAARDRQGPASGD